MQPHKCQPADCYHCGHSVGPKKRQLGSCPPYRSLHVGKKLSDEMFALVRRCRAGELHANFPSSELHPFYEEAELHLSALQLSCRKQQRVFEILECVYVDTCLEQHFGNFSRIGSRGKNRASDKMKLNRHRKELRISTWCP